MRPLHNAVLSELEHERLIRQSAEFALLLNDPLAELDADPCAVERTLAGPTPLSDAIIRARAVQRAAEARGTERAVAFSRTLVGEAALRAGFLRLASVELSEAAELHASLRSSAGEAHAMLLLAEVRFAEGDAVAGHHLLFHALPRARWSRRARHLVPRVHGAMVSAAADLRSAVSAIDRGAEVMREDTCAFCYLSFALPAVEVLADAGDVERARAFAEQVLQRRRLWAGTAVEARVNEAFAHLAAASHEDPVPHFDRAIDRFGRAGRPYDLRRAVAKRARALAA